MPRRYPLVSEGFTLWPYISLTSDIVSLELSFQRLCTLPAVTEVEASLRGALSVSLICDFTSPGLQTGKSANLC
jgi:hypothetical protein